MKRSDQIALLALGVVALSGCATSLTVEGSGVRDATISMVSNCEFKGNFTASDQSGASIDQRLVNVKTKVKNQAGEAGANFVVFATPTTGGILGTQPILSGDAYKCK